MWNPEPPQGHTPEQGLSIIRRSIIPRFEPPQGIGGEAPPLEDKQLQALFPPIADPTFSFYKFYQIKPGQVPTNTETNIGLVITDHIEPENGLPVTKSGIGKDMRVFDSAGVDLKYERNSFNINPDNSIDIEIWFKMGTIKVGEWVQITFGKISAEDGQDAPAVFSEGYYRVFHMNQAGDLVDSLGNANAVFIGTIPPLLVAGKIGMARLFNLASGSHYFEIPDLTQAHGNIEISAWATAIFPHQNLQAMIAERLSTENNIDLALSFTGDKPRAVVIDGSFEQAISPDVIDDDFHRWTGSYDKTILKIYIDNLIKDSKIHPSITESGQGIWRIGIGWDGIPTISSEWNGIIDNIFMSVPRSDNWRTIEYNNQNNPNDFWHKSPLLTNGEVNHLVDNIGQRIKVVGN